MKKYDISIIVASYNPEFNKLKRTIMSLLCQKDITFEIIIADDGSINNYFGELKDLFKEKKFVDYKLVGGNKNEGICLNIHKGLKVSVGKYIKTIGQGDCLFDCNTLKKWYYFMESKDIDVCYGDAIYFCEKENEKIDIVSEKRLPQNIRGFGKEITKKRRFLNYVVLEDFVLGANFLIEANVLKKYINRIVGKIKYAEDMSIQLMIADGQSVDYYPNPVIWYEYGTGISTDKSEKWEKIITDEKFKTLDLMIANNCFKGLERLRLCIVLKMMKGKLKKARYLFVPEIIGQKKRIKKSNIRTKTNVSTQVFYETTKD